MLNFIYVIVKVSNNQRVETATRITNCHVVFNRQQWPMSKWLCVNVTIWIAAAFDALISVARPMPLYFIYYSDFRDSIIQCLLLLVTLASLAPFNSSTLHSFTRIPTQFFHHDATWTVFTYVNYKLCLKVFRRLFLFLTTYLSHKTEVSLSVCYEMVVFFKKMNVKFRTKLGKNSRRICKELRDWKWLKRVLKKKKTRSNLIKHVVKDRITYEEIRW